MKRALLLGLLVPCIATAGAGAKVPTFGPLTIVPGQSLGGVTVGMTKAQAYAKWRAADRCNPGQPQWCNYTAVSTLRDGHKLVNPFAGFYFVRGRVAAVGVENPENTVVGPKVRKLKTSKGIHVGSSMAAARRAYNLPPPSGGEAGRSRATYRQSGNRCTLFYAPESPYTVIDAIQVGRCGVGLG